MASPTQTEIPLNAQLIRNLILSAHAMHDHIVHFFHLSALIAAGRYADARDFADRIESTGVDISGLGAHDSWPGDCRNRFGAHAPLTVDGYPDYPVTSQAQHA